MTSTPTPRDPVLDARAMGARTVRYGGAEAGAAERSYWTATVFDLPFLQTIFLPCFLIFFFLAVAW
jgi:hypothetical protein